ncbi:MAG: agmatine deiminase [Chloroflexi bacterium]|nr:agmatine deiminase [Chloroflexota bacterium]
MSSVIESTPRADGFRMPAEWEAHAGCWMLWPQRPDTWRNGGKPAQRAFAEVARQVSRFEPVTMGVNADQFENARAMLPATVRVVELSSNDAWMRDCGATFVVDGKGAARGVDWIFNAWGGLQKMMYFPWDQDELVAAKMLEIESLDRYKAPLVMEGGSFHVDGQGALITTEQCLLHPNRNPDLTRAEIEQRLADYLNIEKIVWLPRGVYEDETDGHVDNLCCFARPGVVAMTWTDDKADPQYERSAEAYDALRSARDARDRPFEVHKIQQPDPLTMTKEEAGGLDVVDSAFLRPTGERLAGSYINFYIANGGIILPQFNDRHDANARRKLAELYPKHKIIGVQSREILLGGGNIHCITQQQPAGGT